LIWVLRIIHIWWSRFEIRLSDIRICSIKFKFISWFSLSILHLLLWILWEILGSHSLLWSWILLILTRTSIVLNEISELRWGNHKREIWLKISQIEWGKICFYTLIFDFLLVQLWFFLLTFILKNHFFVFFKLMKGQKNIEFDFAIKKFL